MKKFLPAIIILLCISGISLAQTTSEAFMSLPFGHTYDRTQKRMQNSGAKITTPRKESLMMEGYFEGYPARFVFGFYKNKLLKTKAVYLQSMGDVAQDKRFYGVMQTALNAAYGSVKESPMKNPRDSAKLMMRNVWTPDRYTTITLTYTPSASKRFPGNEKFLQLIYKYDKWD